MEYVDVVVTTRVRLGTPGSFEPLAAAQHVVDQINVTDPGPDAEIVFVETVAISSETRSSDA